MTERKREWVDPKVVEFNRRLTEAQQVSTVQDDDYFGRLLADMEAYKPEDAATRERRERRERVQGMLSGIADVGRALGNMYYTTEYAPNGYDGKNGMSEVYQARLEKGKKEREKNNALYVNAVRQYAQAKNVKEARELAAARAAQKAEEKQKAAKEKEREAQEKKEAADAKDYADGLIPAWKAAAWDGTLSIDNAKEELDGLLGEGKITQRQHDAAVAALNKTANDVETEKAKRQYNQTHTTRATSATGGGGRSTGEAIPTHVSGDVVVLPPDKKGTSVISKVYEMLPPEVRAWYGSSGASPWQRRAAVQHFFASDKYSEEEKNAIRDLLIELRDAQDVAATGKAKNDSGNATRNSGKSPMGWDDGKSGKKPNNW